MGDKMATRAEQYIDSLTAVGKISFTVEMFCREFGVTKGAALVALQRLKQQKKIASPCKGYYLVLTPEFRKKGCLPADFFIDDLMRHLKKDYYVSLLSAALYYGAAHQQPQMLQVMVQDKRHNIRCGNVFIEFIKNTHCAKTPIQKIKTRTGFMKVSTSEATAVDIIKYMRQSGGIYRIATVIDELAESMDGKALCQLAMKEKKAPWVSRLGYLLDKLGHIDLASKLYEKFDNNVRITPLVPYAPIVGVLRDRKWRIAINAEVESDLDGSN